MKLEEAKKIMAEENLLRINWYGENDSDEHQVGIELNSGEWVVYITNERASIITGSILKFSSEDEALDNLIERARFLKKYIV